MSENAETVSSNQKSEQRTTDGTPPYQCTPGWIDRVVDAVRDLNPDQITREFVSANVVGSKNEGKVLNALRFLGLIDQQGNVTARFRALRVVGPEFTTNLAIVMRQAYSELFGTIAIKSASRTRLINFLMQKYSMGQSQAESAARFFVHLASRAGMELSAELSPSEKQGRGPRKELSPKVRISRQQPSPLEIRNDDTDAFATIDGDFGRIRVVDESTLELARKLLDMIETKLRQKKSTGMISCQKF